MNNINGSKKYPNVAIFPNFLCHFRGSPEEWDWDGSFGSPTNPKPGGEQSKWVQENAQSGGGRNEEYYGKIEDDNRKGHVKFRKNNPIFYEQIPELLPRLEKIENNVYKPCTYCKYDPKTDDDYQKLVSRLSGNGNSNKNGRKKGVYKKYLYKAGDSLVWMTWVPSTHNFCNLI